MRKCSPSLLLTKEEMKIAQNIGDDLWKNPEFKDPQKFKEELSVRIENAIGKKIQAHVEAGDLLRQFNVRISASAHLI